MTKCVLVTIERRNDIGSLLRRMSRSQSGSWFPWKLATLGLLVLIYYVGCKDVEKHGSFKASRTGLFLRDVGLYEHAVSSHDYMRGQGLRAAKWVGDNGPVYYNKTAEVVGPYYVAARNGVDAGWNYVKVKTPVVLDQLNEYVPGLKPKLTYAWEETCSFVSFMAHVWIPQKLALVVDWLAYYSRELVHALQKFYADVASGRINSSHVKAFAVRTYETTLQHANRYYTWLSEQIRQMIK